jgi:uncharacterized protein involved in exopolysaccharide biosynthesis
MTTGVRTGHRNTMFSDAEPCVESPAQDADTFRHEPSALLNCAAILWRERRWLARMTAVGGLLTLLMALLVPNRYESSTHLMSPDMRGSSSEALMSGLLSRAGGGLAGLSANLLGVNNTGAIFIGVLSSRSVADDLVKRFDLKKVYRDRRDQDARQDLAERTSISEDRKSEIITISVEDRDPPRAAALAAAYVDELNHLLVQVNTSSAHRERVFIEERLQVVRPQLEIAAKQLSDFSTQTTTLDPKEQGKAMVEGVVTLQGELIANKTELRGLQQIYTVNNVRIRSIEARIGELRHQLEQVRGSGAEPPPSTGDGDDSSYPSFRRLPALGATYADFYREVKLREVVFETLTQQFEMAKIAEAKEIPSVKVLDPANLPEKKSGPPRASITLLGVVLSFAFGAVLVIAKAAWKQVDRDDPRKRFASEVWVDARPAYSRWHRRVLHMRNRFSRSPADQE